MNKIEKKDNNFSYRPQIDKMSQKLAAKRKSDSRRESSKSHLEETNINQSQISLNHTLKRS